MNSLNSTSIASDIFIIPRALVVILLCHIKIFVFKFQAKREKTRSHELILVRDKLQLLKAREVIIRTELEWVDSNHLPSDEHLVYNKYIRARAIVILKQLENLEMKIENYGIVHSKLSST